ncbi:hypothetical protein LV457_09130 [Mycobacterium sp. MYCO198283]|uniref:aa3-type cytochrome oxidase subunit CtaJ n=1 Tax=Mycobacterium sp. MYCO198283 TaxID=2883505 RepID=UPI001E4BA28F|nr:hypothetical protein [Mycobacterium sp. MYCO198283]MCG5432454.1 hypothetical protein [Mycobacterium sp. MYCO198283]
MLIAVGTAALLTAALAVPIFSRKGPHPDSYTLDQEWKHPPILWAAVDEHMFGHVQEQGGQSPHHEGGELRIGGGASGTW